MIGFTCGAFDLLHAGHIVMLQEAKSNCDYLIVGLQTDPTIDRNEKNKPIQSVYERFVQLNAVLVRDVTLPIAIRQAIERKLNQEQEALEYEFRIEKAKQEAERQRIDAEGKATANRILSASLTDKILQEKGIEATIKLSESPNSKVIVIGSGKDGLPIILGNQ